MVELGAASGELELKRRSVTRLTAPFVKFMHVEAASGLVLVGCTALALAAANSPWAEPWQGVWQTPLALHLGAIHVEHTLAEWINDALMTLFFFVVGLEIKRELTIGELRERRKRVLPVCAALAGALVPAGLFVALQWGTPGVAAWAVPTATDIAFVVGCLALLGSRVPPGLKVLMLSLAIIDDLLAVVLIAAVFSQNIQLQWLAGALAGLGLVVLWNRLGVRSLVVYTVTGVGVWVCVFFSGLHPTIAGVVLGLLTPATAFVPDHLFEGLLLEGARSVRATIDDPSRHLSRSMLHDLAFATREAVSPLVRNEASCHPWVAFVVLPLFVLANAGVPVSLATWSGPLALSVAVALVVGKCVGIFAGCYLGVRLGWAALPRGVTWRVLVGAACLGGIGFTMAMFIAGLSVPDAMLPEVKGGVLLGSLVAGVIGLLWLRLTLPSQAGTVSESAAS